MLIMISSHQPLGKQEQNDTPWESRSFPRMNTWLERSLVGDFTKKKRWVETQQNQNGSFRKFWLWENQTNHKLQSTRISQFTNFPHRLFQKPHCDIPAHFDLTPYNEQIRQEVSLFERFRSIFPENFFRQAEMVAEVPTEAGVAQGGDEQETQPFEEVGIFWTTNCKPLRSWNCRWKGFKKLESMLEISQNWKQLVFTRSKWSRWQPRRWGGVEKFQVSMIVFRGCVQSKDSAKARWKRFLRPVASSRWDIFHWSVERIILTNFVLQTELWVHVRWE